jgi:Kdo2-lipid IVA lauroyltransferase/acyltransferase
VRKVIFFLEALLFSVVCVPLVLLPLRISLKAGEILGVLLFNIWRSRRRIALDNIRKSFAELQGGETPQEIVRKNFRNLGRSFAEVIKVAAGMGNQVIQTVEVEGLEHLHAAEAAGRGVLLITGHCGNWELMGIVLSARGARISIVARKINNPYLNRFFEMVRTRHGNRIIYKQGAIKSLMRALKRGESAGILMDQAVLHDEGFVLEFLGRPAWTSKAPALIARKTGAAVIPGFIHRTERGHKVILHPPISLSESKDAEAAIREDTHNFSKAVEEFIKQYPSEWLWIHRRWKRTKGLEAYAISSAQVAPDSRAANQTR